MDYDYGNIQIIHNIQSSAKLKPYFRFKDVNSLQFQGRFNYM